MMTHILYDDNNNYKLLDNMSLVAIYFCKYAVAGAEPVSLARNDDIRESR
jgi:hypothetical protein